MAQSLDGKDRELRRVRFAQLHDAWSASPDHRDPAEVFAERAVLGKAALDLVTGFLDESIDQQAFREGIDHWARKKPVMGFAGPAGSMVLNQLVKDGLDLGVAPLLRRILPVPDDIAEGVARVNELTEFLQVLREHGSAVQLARGPFFLSWMWSLQAPETWRPVWPQAETALQELAFLPAYTETQGDRLDNYLEMLTLLGDEPLVVEEVLSWYGKGRPVGLDPSLPERCALAMQLPRALSDTPGVPNEGWHRNELNIRIGLTELNRVARSFQDDVAAIIGEQIQVNIPPQFWIPYQKRLRGDLWVSWRPRVATAAPGLRLHVARNGVFLVINPEVNRNSAGFLASSLATLQGQDLTGLSFFSIDSMDAPEDGAFEEVTVENRGNAYNLGVRLDEGHLGDAESLHAAVLAAAKRLAPLIKAVLDAPEAAPVIDAGEDLGALASQFVAARGYPDDRAAKANEARAEWAAQLAPARLQRLSKETFRQILAGRYGGPGPQSILNATVRDADDEEWLQILRTIDVLLWGEQPVEQRINRVLDEDDLGFRGLKESVVMKLLAIAEPERFLPVFPYSGDSGKAAMLERLGSPLPDLQATPGDRHVQSNDALRSLTEPLFPGDPWGQMCFLYWLKDEAAVESGPDVETAEDEIVQRIGDAAGRVYLDAEFLTDIYELLRTKRQVIFYGPPGTGKTFIAQELAAAISPDPDRRMLIQFHPSSTYEDFFEGYRPEPTSEGGLTYRLVPGPLRLLADRAAADPQHTYLLIIDELNRANLPKVFGELLFLLEYRDRSARLLYRPDEEFQLPPNLWLIGTMNTADRSIALVDAALRRRFQFIPFVPDVAGKSPIANVLKRWVEENEELETLPDIVDKVNNQLRVALGGDHLLLGPSYFMQSGIDEEMLRRIWEYQVEPLIEDLFFGEPTKADAFRFDRVWDELGSPATDDGSPVDADATVAGDVE